MVNDDPYYERLQESWPEERPSRKRAKRRYRRKQPHTVVVRATRREAPEPERMSRALLAAQRELAEAQAEHDARQQEDG